MTDGVRMFKGDDPRCWTEGTDPTCPLVNVLVAMVRRTGEPCLAGMFGLNAISHPK